VTATDKFFQFPIAALHLGKEIDTVEREEMETRLSTIIDFCIIEIGTGIYKNKPEETTLAMAQRGAESCDIELPDEPTRNQLIMFSGVAQLGIKCGSPNWSAFKKSHSLIANKAARHGSQQCRLKTTFVWEAKDTGNWNWRDLTTLAAVYSGVGAYQRQKLTYDRIGAMALGFNGQRERDAADAKQYQLTDKQTLRTVNNLRNRNFFVSASPNKRHVFYSHRLSLDQLIDNLASKPEAKLTAASITERIRQRQIELAVKT